MPKSFCALILLSAISCSSATAATLDAAVGSVLIKRDKVTSIEVNDQNIPVSLASGDRITTGSTGKARVQLDDGSELSLSANSEFQIKSEDKTSIGRGYFELFMGKVRVLVKKRANANAPTFRIRASDAVMGVRGTEFIVEASRDGAALCTFEGSVEVDVPSNASESKIVSANEGIVISMDGKLSAPVMMDPHQMNWWRQETNIGQSKSDETTLRLLGTDWQWNGPTAVDSLNSQALRSKYTMLSLGGSLWGRTIYTDEIPLTSSTRTHEQVNATGRLGLDATLVPNKYFLFFGEVMGAMKAGHTNADRTKFIFQQGFALARSQEGHSIALGRQEWNFGDGLVLGRDPWSPVTRTFDGALATLRFAPVRVRAFGAALGDRVDSTELEDYVAGSYVDFSKIPVDLYGMWVKRRGARLAANSLNTNTSHAIIGERLGLGPWNSFFLNEEFAYQFGEIGVAGADRGLSAYLAYLDGGVMWSAGRVSGYAKAVYLRASGDKNPNDNDHQSFMPLAPDTHRFLGLINVFPQMRNIERIGASVAARTEILNLPFTAQVDYSRFNRLSLVETLQPVRNASARFLGQEYDLQLGFEPHPKTFIQLGTGYFIPGEAITVSEDNGFFAYVMAQYQL